MSKIKEIYAREILNAKGDPTIETTVSLTDGSVGIAMTPGGIILGKYEAVELRDQNPRHFQGRGVLKAIDNITQIIAPKLAGMEANKQQDIDRTMIDLDGTQNKSRLGANATISVSMAVAKAAAKSSTLPLYLYLREFINKKNLALKIPTPIFNLINGGKHGNGNLDIQEFLLLPASFKGYNDSLQLGVSVDKKLEEALKENGHTTLTGIEGGFSPNLITNEEALAYLSKAVEMAEFKDGYDVFLGIDAAANYFFKDGHYKLKDNSITCSQDEIVDYYFNLLQKYRLLYIEDPMSEDDWDGWLKLHQKISSETFIVGDDLTATNPIRLQMALDKKTVNAIVIKPNQIGTVIETLAVVEIARQSGLKLIVSQRSGETNDDFIADFAVAVSADYVKFGAPSRGEHVVKYNRLLEIEKQLKLI